MSHPDDHDYDYDDDDRDDEDEWMMNCHMDPDGLCLAAGSENCDTCPHWDLEKGRTNEKDE